MEATKLYFFKSITAVALACVMVMLGGCSDSRMQMGEQVFNKTCIACHNHALNGAPILGNQKMWDKRLSKGVPTLVQHAQQGFGLMPARGGNMELTNDQVAAAVEFMVSKVQ